VTARFYVISPTGTSSRAEDTQMDSLVLDRAYCHRIVTRHHNKAKADSICAELNRKHEQKT